MRTLLLVISFLIQSFSGHSQLEVSHDSGFYNEPISVTLKHSDPEVIFYYTTDGSQPDRTKQRYTSPISMGFVASPATLSYIRTGENWVRPNGEVYKGHLFKFVAFKNNEPITPIETRTFFVDPNHLQSFPIDRLSLTVEPDDFFGEERGIYVPGNNTTLNFYQGGEDWERPALFELFDQTGKLEWKQTLGARVHGRSSRTNPQKSLRFYAKSAYGSPFIFHELFGENGPAAQKRIILRAPDRLFSKAIFIDELVHAAAEDLSVENMASRPVVVFINGEYWGIQNLRERHDEQYLRIKFGVEPNNVDIVDWDRGPYVSEGNLTEYNKLLNYLSSSDLSTIEGYNGLKALVNMESFIPFVGTHIFFANEDFPNNNLRMWRERTFGEKWNFFFYDCDGCMRDVEMDTFEMYANTKNDGNPASIMLKGLLKNTEFMADLQAFLNNALSNQFSAGNLLKLINEKESFYAPLVNDHINRWHSPDDTAEWLASIAIAEKFAMNRSHIMGELIQKHLGKPYSIYPTPAKSEFYLDFEKNPEDMDIRVSLSDMSGKTFQPSRIYTSESLVSIPVDDFSPGVYIVQVVVGRSIYYDKIIISQ